MAKQSIRPFFIPLAGCPQQCIYCDQRSLSGAQTAPEPAAVEQALAEFQGGPASEAAFYGGSFSALPEARQRAYLSAAQPARQAGRIGGIRISTRPDAIDAAKLALLADYGVTTIELGVQSLAAPVLAAAGRGYPPEQAVAACQLVKQAGFRLGIQLMTGLPQDTPHLALQTMRQVLRLQPDFLRIYPTVVLADTPLAARYQAGAYQPQSLVEAVTLGADLLALAEQAGVPVIRLGLQPCAELEQALLAGPYHPAFGQLVKAHLKLLQIKALGLQPQELALLLFPRRELPLVGGQGKEQMLALGADYPQLVFCPRDDLPPGMVVLKSDTREVRLSQADFLDDYLQKFAEII